VPCCHYYCRCDAGSKYRSVASVGVNGSNQNLCRHESPSSAACRGKAKAPGAVGAAASGAVSNYGHLGISGSVTVSNNGGSGLTMEADANAVLNDSFVITNLTQTSYFVVSIASSAGGTSDASVSEVVNLFIGGTLVGSCSNTGIGNLSCNASTPISAPSSGIDLRMSYIGIAGVNCGYGCGAGASSFDAKSQGGGGKILAVIVADANGNPVKGASVTSASGHTYPSRFASTTTLTSSLNPSNQGDPVTFTATVSAFGRPSTPTGKVTFKDLASSTTLGHATLVNGVATFTTSTLSHGTHSIVASYGGDTLSAGSKSAALAQQVN